MGTEKSDKILARLMQLHPKLIDLSLGRMHAILDKLGNPERALPPVIHVAGTNGKGSTVANIRAMTEAAGHRVHIYTSPHLVRFAERIRLAGTLIEEGHLSSMLGRVEEAADGDPITFFEATTAAALLAFSETPADICLLEVGLGGRLDATNVIENPISTIITPVSLDHQQFLGETLNEIAGEKAGIIKPNVPVIVGPQKKVALSSIAETAQNVGAEMFIHGEHWHIEARSSTNTLLYEDTFGALELPMPSLLGAHQAANTGTAIAALRLQRAISIPESAIKAGIGWIRWPARLQDLSPSPLINHLPGGSELWLDGGHNPAAAEVLRGFLQRYDVVDNSISLVLGMMGTKDAAGFLGPLVGHIEQVVAVPIPGEAGAANPAELAAKATDLGINGTVAKDVVSALDQIAQRHAGGRQPIVIIGGSLYLSGQVLKLINWLPN